LAHAENLRPSWGESPGQLLEAKEFWNVLTGCLSGLPEAQRRAFSMREFDGFSSDEIREVLDVSPTNLWVMLHRARAKLRRCLEVNWFETK
jgi:RNA polymerase sigma-70 factor (ECF subfamily)